MVGHIRALGGGLLAAVLPWLAGTAASHAQESIFANPPPFDSTYFGTCTPDQSGGCNDVFMHANGVSADGGVVVGSDDLGFAVAWLPNFASPDGPHGLVFLDDNPADFGFPGFDVEFSEARDVNAAGTAIVGSSLISSVDPGCGCDLGFFVPLLWTGAAPGWTVSALPVLTGSNPLFQGQAWAINDAGTFASGWSGPVSDNPQLKAVRWVEDDTTGTWTVQHLGAPVDETSPAAGDDSSVAADISESGKVAVGWQGPNFNLFLTDLPIATLDVTPFAWTETSGQTYDPAQAFGTVHPLQVLPVGSPHQFGAALAVNGDGTAAVGWSAASEGDAAYQYRAVLWTTNDNWTSNGLLGLGNVDTSKGISGVGKAGTVTPLGTVADAVDAAGGVIVGRFDFVDPCLCALDSRAALWEGADGFKGHLIEDLLAAAHVDLGGFILENARAVRTIYDVTGTPTDTIIVGDGRNADAEPSVSVPPFYLGTWLVRLGKDSGVATPEEVSTSFGNAASLLDQVGDDVGAPLFGLSDVGQHQLCKSSDPSSPFCFFAFGTATTYSDLTGSEFVGDVGIARRLGPNDSLGLSVGANQLSVRLDDRSSAFDGNSVHLGSFLAHTPESGFQSVAAASVSFWNDLDITRAYQNGAGMASSSGSTDGFGYGLSLWSGYAMPVTPAVMVTPFAQITYQHDRFDAWTETGGPFPASFAETEGSSTDVRLGVEDKARLSAVVSLFGSAAWVHRLAGEGPAINGSLLVAGCNSSTPFSSYCGLNAGAPARPADWFEATLGTRLQLAAGSTALLSVTLDAGADFFAATGRAGFGRAF
jgi:uncharacterized membrane protein/uncharacterized protein YhjY with autotransporter beta-barrel domain